MAPIAIADLEGETNDVLHTTDPSVFPSPNATIRLKKLWAQHGSIESSRYQNPELTSLSSLVKYNVQTRPSDLAYLVPRGDTFASITWQQFDHLTEYAAAHYSRAFQSQIETGTSSGTQPTIALLGTGNTFRYWVSQIALLKLGVRLLLLSDKNADVARDHLLESCSAVGIVVEHNYVVSVQHLQMPVVPFVPVSLVWVFKPVTVVARFESEDVWNQQAMIIHSSGSTGLPKPIIHTNRSMMLIARMYRLFQSFIVENWYLCFPLYHIAGVSIILGGLPTGLSTSFPPENWPPSPSNILNSWRTLHELGTPVDCLHCAPAVIEDLYEHLSISTVQDFSPLTNLKILQPGGAALSPAILQKLVALGVNVKTTYGSTEIGPPYRTIPDTNNTSCYQVRYLFPDDPHVKMEPQAENMYECVVYKGFGMAAELWTDSEAANPYRTNDLFTQDPPGSGLYVLQGRKDDIVIHSNGEKTNALPLQMAIQECHPAISSVVVFGTDKPCTSAIIEISKEVQVDLENVYKAIDQACKSFPSYSRVDRSLILVLTQEETLPVTPKGNVRRKDAQKLYGERLEALYAKFLDSVEEIQESDETASLNDLEFVRRNVAIICSIPAEKIQDTTSFYTVGMESQKAVRLRSRLSQRFGKFPLMFIFEYPSILALSKHLSTPRTVNEPTKQVKNTVWIEDTISRYTSEIRSWSMNVSSIPADEDAGEIIYLTGATGALGNALISTFAIAPEISKVYCAIREPFAETRLKESLRQRGYASQIYTSDKLVCIPYDMSSPTLGLDEGLYASLASEITIVVHNAWKMDFNLPVDCFEEDCLRGAMNLMRLCTIARKKTFAFTSSVATNFGKSALGKTIAETPIANDPSLALETGYAQSKFIVEIITQIFAETCAANVQMMRVGQLCGHSVLGKWNTTEMFPIMISTGLGYLNAMPRLGQRVDWLPVDVCAEAVSTLLLGQIKGEQGYELHNLVNPEAMSWEQFLDGLEEASGVAFERVSMPEWVQRLQAVCEENPNVPGGKLLGFFEDMAQAKEEGDVVFDAQKTAKLVPRLGACGKIDVELIRLYLAKWREIGFI
ncbi:male sterility protein [Delphinella strobiligena]|nr:male sterility protein [Delphinella strobiligena]